MITLQDIFNAAWQAFVVEKRLPAVQDMDRGLTCRYLTDDGRKCAVGLCIPDGHEAQQFEGSFGDLAQECYPELFDDSIKSLKHLDLETFQRSLHDGLQKRGQWRDDVDLEKQYREVAKRFNLTIPGETK